MDEAAGVVYAPRSKTGVPRNIPLNETLRTVLKEAKAQRTRIDADAPVFLGREGRRPRVYCRESALRRAYRDAEMEGVSMKFKVFRHTLASGLAMQGESMRTIAELMGQSTTEITERYVHLSPEHLRSTMDRRLAYWSLRGHLADNKEQKEAKMNI